MSLLLLGLAAFVLTHSLKAFAPAWRERRLAGLGTPLYRGVFSVVSLLSLAAIVVGYRQCRLDALVWVPPADLRFLTVLLMLMACVLMAASFTRSHLRLWTKHPQLTAIKAWATAHLLVNGHLAAILLFSTILAWAVGMRIHHKRSGSQPKPFDALLLHDLIAVGAGLWTAALLILGLHRYLFGVSPLL